MRAVDRPIGCGPRIDRSGNAAANRLEAVIARIARRESDTRETRERAQWVLAHCRARRLPHVQQHFLARQLLIVLATKRPDAGLEHRRLRRGPSSGLNEGLAPCPL